MNRRIAQGMFVSKFKGVYFDKGAQRWRAEIPVCRGSLHLGCFDDETEAARAYNARFYGSYEKNEI